MAAAAVVAVLAAATGAYASYFDDRIVPNTRIGAVRVGGLTRDEAADRLEAALGTMASGGIQLAIDGTTETIATEAIGLDMNLAVAVDAAFARGHGPSGAARVWERISAMWTDAESAAPIAIDDRALSSALDDIATVTGHPRQDIRLETSGASVELLTDTAPGRAINRETAAVAIRAALGRLEPVSLALPLEQDLPQVAPSSGPEALKTARRMLARPLALVYEDYQFNISRERLGGWLTNEYERGGGEVRLVPGLDAEALGQFVAGIAQKLNVSPEPPQVNTQDGRITGFVPAKVGRAVQEDALIGLITDAVRARARDEDDAEGPIAIPMKVSKMALTGLDASTGITELIGKATTTFAGSPKNRIYNIKNGVKFLSGAVIRPGDEFSTLLTLGSIDNTNGYLPELVIKGDRTTPEFGGGLCQVSTTLFRAIMDAGLPITARRNHSYRVSYYEKDANGKPIGPGLDATIYEPDTDLRFRNDMPTPILVIGYVVGDKVTFELYGTKDGRTSSIDGPHLLTSTPPGDPVYLETLDLPPGTVKQVETPHPGGSTVATYTITYPDGRVASQEFRSWYRRWPAKFLKGVTTLSSPTPFPVSPSLPSATP